MAAMLSLPACAGSAMVGVPVETQDVGVRVAELTARQENDLRYHASILRNEANDLPTRAGAAERLLRLHVPQAIAVLEEMLRSGNPAMMLPVIRAMGQSPEPIPGLRESAVEALRTAPQGILDQLVIVVAKYEEAAFGRVSDLAGDRSGADAQRLGPIIALGSFPTRKSGDLLMELADPQRGEPEALRAAAFGALRRLAGLDLGNDYRQWRDWWEEARDKSREDWARDLVRQYQDRNAELERLHAEVARRFVELLRELYRTLPLEKQFERLNGDIEDELAPVRQFAVRRIARLLRDSEMPPEGLKQKIAARLDDRSAGIRREAAELLDELNEPNAATMIVDRLERETDRQVIGTYLQVLARRPTEASREALLRWLGDAELGGAAGEALWELLPTVELSAEAREKTVARVQEVFEADRSPLAARLLAFMVEDPQRSGVEGMLDGPEAELRRGVAEGLCRRGLHEPLVRRAGDDVIYPYAVRALAAGPADLRTLGALASLEAPASGVREWEEAVGAVAGRLDPKLVMAADDLLMETGRAGPALRARLLSRGSELPAEQREAVLMRLVPLLLEQGEGLRGLELMESMNGVSVSESFLELKFRAAVFAGRYEAAEQIRGGAEAWVRLLEETATTNPEVARSLQSQIDARFGGELEGDLKRGYEAAAAKLAPPVESENGQAPENAEEAESSG